MTTHAQYIIRVDKTNIDYSNKRSKARQSHGNNTEQQCTQELMINKNIK